MPKSKTKFRVLGNQVGLDMLPLPPLSKIIDIPDDAQRRARSCNGRVFSVGSKVTLDIKVGDVIMCPDNLGFRIPHSEKRIYDANDLIAIIS